MLTPLTNHEKIGRALDHLRRGLLPLIDARLRPEDKASWQIRSRRGAMWKSTDLDVKDCLEILDKFWDGRFRGPKLGRGERAWINELVDKVRNQHAHRRSTEDVPDDDAWRALDTAERLLAAFGSHEAENVRVLRLSLRDKPSAPAGQELSLLVSKPSEPVGRPKSELSSTLESLHLPDLLGGITIVGSSRGLRSIRFGAGEVGPGRRCQMPNSSYESISVERGHLSTSPSTYKAHLFSLKFGAHCAKFPTARRAVTVTSRLP
jgi:hypothetical protein